MFFYEWIIPSFTLLVVIAAVFYISVKNRTGAGIRSEGRTLFDKLDDDDTPSVG